MPPKQPVPSTPESRADSNRVLLGGMRALANMIEQIEQTPSPLPPTQSCRMAML